MFFLLDRYASFIFYVVCVEKKKFDAKIRLHETLCEHIEYGDIHVNIFSKYFNNLKAFFLLVKIAYAREMKISVGGSTKEKAL